MSDREKLEDYLILAHELQKRREADPLKTFPLHEKQKLFVDSVLQGKKKENWFIAANRSGKSDAGAYIGATLARFGRTDGGKWDTSPNPLGGVAVKDRATSGWVSALDFPTSRDVIQPKYFDNRFGMRDGRHQPFIPDHEIERWDPEAQVLRLKNGSLIGFKSAESGRRKYQGADRDWLHMDEEHPWEIYQEAVIRVGQSPLIVFCTCTILPPEGGNQTVSWVFPKIIQPWQEGRLPNAGLFGASIYDNPGIARDEIKRLEAIYPEGSAARRIRLNGEWIPGIGGARAYPSFERSIHVTTEITPIAFRQPLLWTWDFNVEPMTSSVWQRHNGVYNCYHALYLEEGSIRDMVDLFYYNVPRHGAAIWLYGDSTGKGRIGQTGKSDYWTIMNEMRQYGCPIKLRVPEDNPRVPDRINAVNRLMQDENGQVRVQLCAHNTRPLIEDFENVLRDNRGGVMKVTNKKDPYFWRTHSSDGAGYMLAFEEPVRLTSSGVQSGVPGALSGPRYGFGAHH
jgi:phage terminase large subunit-like protein